MDGLVTSRIVPYHLTFSRALRVPHGVSLHDMSSQHMTALSTDLHAARSKWLWVHTCWPAGASQVPPQHASESELRARRLIRVPIALDAVNLSGLTHARGSAAASQQPSEGGGRQICSVQRYSAL